MLSNIKINQDRLWESIMEMARIGATPKGGCNRLALTDLDREARDLFISWCEEAGCTVSIDRMGNIFARRPGKDPEADPVVFGSHLDTQPTGGKFDGVFGVLSALEVVRTLNDHSYETDVPLEIAVWTNEEGSRFAPAMIASGVFAGVFTEDYGMSRIDLDGKTIGEELERIGYRGELPCGGRRFKAFFEAHIEQGPILEAENKTIGVVTGIQGIRWFECTITGSESHAGTTPMPMRRDALLGAARVIDEASLIAQAHAPNAVTTVGLIQAHPNSRNVVPGSVFFTVDLRHPDGEVLAEMASELEAVVNRVTGELKLTHNLHEIWYSPPAPFDKKCIESVRYAAEEAGYSWRDIVSGAGHDAGYVSKVAPAAMIFVPCAGGISHNETESATPDDLGAGCNVLLKAVLAHALA
jgi:beta-ureidopropionase / N-carbamoyl-L-amino-acid hydrolase